MKKFAVLLLALVLCLCACSAEPAEPKIHTTSVIRSGIFEYGNFVYFSLGEIYRYNIATGELGSACLEPECDGKCPLHGAMTRIGALEDGKLFFYSFEAFVHNIHFGYQDLISGEVTVLDTVSDYEFVKDQTFVSGGSFYYYAGILKEGGDPKNHSDYESHLCRIPISGGEREVLESPSGIPQLIVDGKLVMISSSAITLYDLEGGLEKVVWNYAENGFSSVSELSYYNGRIYAIAKMPADGAEILVNEYNGVKYAKNTFLISADINTGEWKKVSERAVESYTVTDDRVYYFPTELRYLYVPENADKNADDVVTSLFSATLYSCKHDGSDERAEYTNENINTCLEFTAIDGKLCGKMSIYDEAMRDNSRTLFCTVDLASGEVIDSHDLRS